MCLCVRVFVSLSILLQTHRNAIPCIAKPKPKMGYMVLRLCHYRPICIFSSQLQCYYSVAVPARIYLIISW